MEAYCLLAEKESSGRGGASYDVWAGMLKEGC